MSESNVQNEIRRAATLQGILSYRNNVGAFEDATGRWLRYGLCNDDAELNKRIKSSDLICVVPTLVTHDMIGRRLGVFTAIETKREDWKFRQSDKRAVAQKRFHDIVKEAGGYAGFAQSVDDMYRIIGWMK